MTIHGSLFLPPGVIGRHHDLSVYGGLGLRPFDSPLVVDEAVWAWETVEGSPAIAAAMSESFNELTFWHGPKRSFLHTAAAVSTPWVFFGGSESTMQYIMSFSAFTSKVECFCAGEVRVDVGADFLQTATLDDLRLFEGITDVTNEFMIFDGTGRQLFGPTSVPEPASAPVIATALALVALGSRLRRPRGPH